MARGRQGERKTSRTAARSVIFGLGQLLGWSKQP
jgi:hypothetical protein